MFTLDEEFADRVFSYCRERLALNPVPLDFGSVRGLSVNHLDGCITPHGRPPDEVLDIFTRELAEHVISTDSSKFLAFIPNAPTKASLLFDMVVACSGLNGTSWLESAGAVVAENHTLEFLATAAGMPPGSGGAFVSGGTIANLSALTVARDVGAARRPDSDRHRLCVAVSEESHSSISAALHILGVDALVVPTTDHRLTRADLEAAMSNDPRAQNVIAVVATAGTTNAGIIDDLEGLGDYARSHELWFHIDGAYGGAGILSERLAPCLTGIRHADSFIVDPHKWLFAPLDCAGLIYREPHLARAVHTQHAGYLDILHAAPDTPEWNPSDYAIHLSRRPRGLALWFSLTTHGTNAYAAAIDAGLDLAQYAAAVITDCPVTQLLRTPELTNVVFSRDGWTAEDYQRWATSLLERQIAFVAPSVWEGRACGRFSFLHPDIPRTVIDEIVATLVEPGPNER